MKKFSLLILLFSISYLPSFAQCPNYSRPGVHVVQSGENLYRISQKYNISSIELAEWNNIPVDITLYACQELMVSAPYSTNGGYQTAANDFVDRSPSSFSSGSAFIKQAGNKHTIRQGETISGLAELYGYTEKRFRSINLLKPGEELSVGSVIISTDCACDRILAYDDINNSSSTRNYGNDTRSTSYNNGNNSRNSYYDETQNRGGNFDSFYDTDQGKYGGAANNPPAAVPIDRIRSNTNPPAATTNNRNNNRVNTTSNNNSGRPNPVVAAYMSSEELAMLDEINLMRSNPVAYIPYIEQYKRDIQSGKSFGSSLAVCDELISELRRTPPLSILKPAPCLYTAAKNHGLDQKARGNTGHTGSDGSWPWDRVKNACQQMTDGNENLVGGLADVRESVILLLVDDGISNRGHRKTLLNKDWVYGSTYKIGKVGYMPNCWVQKFGY